MQTYTPNRKRVEDTDIQETDVMNKLKLKSILEGQVPRDGAVKRYIKKAKLKVVE